MKATRAAAVTALAALAMLGGAEARTCDVNGYCDAESINPDGARARNLMREKAHEIETPLSPPLPRLSVDDLKLPGNEAYNRRELPFILTGAMEGWGALDRWTITKEGVRDGTDYLSGIFAESVTDLYPWSMLVSGQHPYLSRFKRGLRNVILPPGDYHDDGSHRYTCEDGCRYIHLQLTPKAWDRLEELGDIPKKRHPHVRSDPWWMRRCLQDEAVREEYHIKTHWKIILIGTRGSGMFDHSDSLMSSSWHAHVQGEKWWRVCHPKDRSNCQEAVLRPGEVLYYGQGYYHTTRNMENPSMTVTGTVVTRSNYEGLADKLHAECSRSALGFKFSSRLCDALDKCYGVWSRVLAGKEQPGRWPSWRSVATAEEIAIRESVRPEENNYDGRNYIAEN